jgi:hypothetical protein
MDTIKSLEFIKYHDSGCRMFDLFLNIAHLVMN